MFRQVGTYEELIPQAVPHSAGPARKNYTMGAGCFDIFVGVLLLVFYLRLKRCDWMTCVWRKCV